MNKWDPGWSQDRHISSLWLQLRIDLNNDDINCSGHHSNTSAGNDTYDDVDDDEFRSGFGKQPDASSLQRKKVTAGVVTTVGAVRWLLCTVVTDIVPAVNAVVDGAQAVTVAAAVSVAIVDTSKLSGRCCCSCSGCCCIDCYMGCCSNCCYRAALQP